MMSNNVTMMSPVEMMMTVSPVTMMMSAVPIIMSTVHADDQISASSC